MILPKVVTFTGADDSVKVEDIIALAADYPDTEWGILFGAGSHGGRRFPSKLWIESQVPKMAAAGLNLCAHLCGMPVYHLVLNGDLTWLYQYSEEVTSAFKRVQLNFHGQQFPAPANSFLTRIQDAPYQFIFQNDGVNGHLIGSVSGEKRVRLFDVSHGAGVLPDETGWPERTRIEYMGYAGGLGPDNIKAQLKLIEAAAKPVQYSDFWIDMETRVRSNRDKLFDLTKVRKVCQEVWG